MPPAEYDFFISHATEDKEDFVRPLADALIGRGLNIWFDELSLEPGDSLRESIDLGLTRSRYGIVILSKAFIAKKWPQYELNGLLNRQNQATGNRIVLPIWHGITHKELSDYSPSIADIYALDSKSDLEHICTKLIKKINQDVEPEVKVESVPSDEVEVIEQPSEEEILEQIKTKKQLITTLEKYLVDDRNRINLFKLTHTNVEILYSKLQEDFLDLMGKNPSGELIKGKMDYYDTLCENTLALLINGCYWSQPEQNRYWIKAIERIANAKNAQGGYIHLINLQYYPALLLMYGAGVAAIASENFHLLKGLWLNANVYENREKKPLLSQVFPGGVIDKDIINQALGKSYRTPVSDRLYETLRPEFSMFIPEDEEFADIFDLFEYMLGMQFGYLMSEPDSGHFWGPIGRFHWRHYSRGDEGPRHFVAEEIKQKGNDWSPLKAGLFGGTLDSLETTKQRYDDLLRHVPWF